MAFAQPRWDAFDAGRGFSLPSGNDLEVSSTPSPSSSNAKVVFAPPNLRNWSETDAPSSEPPPTNQPRKKTRTLLVQPGLEQIVTRIKKGAYTSPAERYVLDRAIKSESQIRELIDTQRMPDVSSDHSLRVIESAFKLIRDVFKPQNVFKLYLDVASTVAPDGTLMKYTIDLAPGTPASALAKLCSYWGAGRTVTEVEFETVVPSPAALTEKLSNITHETCGANQDTQRTKRHPLTTAQLVSLPLRHIRSTPDDSPMPSTPTVALMKHVSIDPITDCVFTRYFIVCDSYDHRENTKAQSCILNSCRSVEDVANSRCVQKAVASSLIDRQVIIREACDLLGAKEKNQTSGRIAAKVIHPITKDAVATTASPFEYDAAYANLLHVKIFNSGPTTHSNEHDNDDEDNDDIQTGYGSMTNIYRFYNGCFCTTSDQFVGGFAVGCGLLKGFDIIEPNAQIQHLGIPMMTIGNLSLKSFPEDSDSFVTQHKRASAMFSHNGTMMYRPDIFGLFAAYRDRSPLNASYERAIHAYIGVPANAMALNSHAVALGSIDPTSLILSDYLVYHPDDLPDVYVASCNTIAVKQLFALLAAWGSDASSAVKTQNENVLRYSETGYDGHSSWVLSFDLLRSLERGYRNDGEDQTDSSDSDSD